MKKISTFLGAFMVIFGLSAQQEVGVIDVTNFTTEAAAQTANTVLAQTASVKMSIGADDSYKIAGAAANGYATIKFGETELDLANALQGNTNPKDIDTNSPAQSLKAPATGCFYLFEVAKDGYLYVFHKASSNKNYTVFEEGTAIGYQFAMQTADEFLGSLYTFELQGEGELNEVKDTIYWPEQYKEGYTDYLNSKDPVLTKIGASGVGVIKFPVYKDCKYIANAVGSKMTCAGFAFDTDGKTLVSIVGADVPTLNLMNGTNSINQMANHLSVVYSKYYLLSGEEVAAPQMGNRGLYIVKSYMSNGTISVSKIVLK